MCKLGELIRQFCPYGWIWFELVKNNNYPEQLECSASNKMTERLQNIVSVPVWFITLLVNVLFTVMGFTVNASAKTSNIETKIETCKENLNGKVDQSQYEAEITYI